MRLCVCVYLGQYAPCLFCTLHACYVFAETLINSIIFAGAQNRQSSAAQADWNRCEHIINNATARFVPRCVYVMCNVRRVCSMRAIVCVRMPVDRPWPRNQSCVSVCLCLWLCVCVCVCQCEPLAVHLLCLWLLIVVVKRTWKSDVCSCAARVARAVAKVWLNIKQQLHVWPPLSGCVSCKLQLQLELQLRKSN